MTEDKILGYLPPDISTSKPKDQQCSVVDEKAILILTKDRNERTDEEIDYCVKSLINVTFIKATLKRYGPDSVKSILKVLTFMEVPEKEIIFRLGEIGFNCFILFEGSCEVLIPGVVKTARVSTFDNVRVGIVNQGILFGEKSLVDKKPRNANIKTMTKCFLGELKKKDYIQIFDNIKKIEVNEEIDFFKSIKLFANCNRSFVEKFTYCMEPKEYGGEEIIFNQNDLIDKIFLVRRGLFEVYFKTEKNLDAVFDLNYFSEINSNDHQRFSDNRLYEIKGYKKTSDLHKLFVLGPGELFGDIELMQNTDKSLFTLKCIQKGSEILVCAREKFVFNIGQILFESLQQQVKEKIINYKDRFKRIKIQKKGSQYSDQNKLNNQIVQRVLQDNKNKSDRMVGKGNSTMNLKSKNLRIDLECGNINACPNQNINNFRENDRDLNNSFDIDFEPKKSNNKIETKKNKIGNLESQKKIINHNSKENFGMENLSNIGKRTKNKSFTVNVGSFNAEIKRFESEVGIINSNNSKNNFNQNNEIKYKKIVSLTKSNLPTKTNSIGRNNKLKNSPNLKISVRSILSKNNHSTMPSSPLSPLNSNNKSNFNSMHKSEINFKSRGNNSNNLNIFFANEKEREEVNNFNNENRPDYENRHENENEFKKSDPLRTNSYHIHFKKDNLFILSKDKSTNNHNSGMPSQNINMNINLPFYVKNKKTIFKENSKFKFSECAEINKKFYLDNDNIASVLKSKYNFLKKNSNNYLYSLIGKLN